MSRRTIRRVLLSALLITVYMTGASASVIRVKPTGNDSYSGLSWTLAKRTVGAALTVSQSGDEIWIAEGTYNQRITLKAGVALYGGFNGNESQRSGRDFRTNPTVLDGGVSGSVVTVAVGADSSTVLDGFTVQNGYKNFGNGAGLYCSGASPTIRNCVFAGNILADSGNYNDGCGGGAFFNNSSALVSTCTFRNNRAVYGGGIFVSGGSVTISNCVLFRNLAAETGGGICSRSSALLLVGSTLAENTDAFHGGGIYHRGGNVRLSNNIVAFNSTGVLSFEGVMDLRSNCVFGNSGANYLDITDPTGNNGNISVDPQLAGVAGGNLHLQPTSPCIDAGNNAENAGSVDIDGQARVIAGVVDMGADESDGTSWPATGRIVYARTSGNDAASGLSWALAKRTVGAALSAAQPGDEVWVAEGIYIERITLKVGVAFYGGFAGTESLRSQRDFRMQPVVLDGDAAGSVVTVPEGAGSTTVLDGFTIRNGNAQAGGGLYTRLASPIIRHCLFTGNTAATNGGGVYVENGFTRVSTSTFRNNQAKNGGGIGIVDGGIIVSSCILTNNIATSTGNAGTGGAIDADNATIRLENCTIVGNSSGNSGGVLNLFYSSGTLHNNIVAFNSTGVYGFESQFDFRSNCVYGNPGGNYININDPTGTNGNRSVDPLFVNRAAGNLHLLPESPCHESGDNARVLDDEDIDGEARIQDSVVDIGADEIAEAVNPVLSVSLSPASVAGGIAHPIGTVTLSDNAPAGGTVVVLSSSNAAAAVVPASVTVPEGQDRATFMVTTNTVSTTTAVTIGATSGGVTRTATLTVKAVVLSRDITLASDGSLRILQTTGSLVRIAKATGSTVQLGTAYPVPAGWSPTAIAVGPDGKTYLLWNGPDGVVSLMTFNTSGVRESYRVVGTYPGVVSRDIAVAGDGSVRILQTSATLVRILKVTGSTLQYGQAHPVPSGWTPTAIASGVDNKTRLLWSGPGGAVSVMTFNSSGVRDAYQTVGSYLGVVSKDIAVAGDGSVRVLQASTGLARILKVTGSTPQYGAAVSIPSGWTPAAIAAGSDSKTRLLWSCTDGRLGVMTMNASGAREAYVAMGPY